MIDALVLVTALLLDLALGEPPNALHPVVWIGKTVSLLQRPRFRHRVGQLLYGAVMVLVALAVWTVPTWLLFAYLRPANPVLYVIFGAVLLKSTFSVRALLKAAEEVRRPLQEGRLEQARQRLGWLVSRDTTKLSEPLVVAAAVESVAENSSDSFVAPLFFFVLFGPAGAMAYRVINTFDAMVGYHGKYEYLGKFAARFDDLANLVPARLTGLLMVAASQIRGQGALSAWRALWRFRTVTESPNAGWPMSAMAGALNVQLEKEGHYRLGDGSHPLAPATISQANSLVILTVAMATTVFLVLILVKHAYFG